MRRWLKFAAYLPDFGIEPVMYVPEGANYPLIDEALCDEIPPGLQVLKHAIREPYALGRFFSKSKSNQMSAGLISKTEMSLVEKFLLYIRGNFFIPDARKFWMAPSVRYLQNFLKNNEVETIITTGPPHSLHLIGLALKKRLNVRWIADFRDPWTTIGYHSRLMLTKRAAAKHLALETEVLQTADKIIVTSHGTQREFQAKTSKPVVLIPNGFDHRMPAEAPILSDKFRITHTGSLSSERNPGALWAVLRAMVSENRGFASDLELHLAGRVSDEAKADISRHHLDKYANYYGFIPHHEVEPLILKSQVLLLTEVYSAETANIVPAKLFEYLAARRPILALGPPRWSVDEILLETASGKSLDSKDTERIEQTIRAFYTDFKEGRLQSSSINIERYDRRQLTKRLASEILND